MKGRNWNWRLLASLSLTLGLGILATRVWLIGTWGSPIPYWDEWDGSGLALYRGWLQGTIGWHDIFAPHNEHRIALTRITDLALFRWRGEWDPWSQLLMNSVLHAITAALCAALLLRDAPPRQAAVAAIGLALLFAAPCDWQNALFGFQSQFYYANLLGLISVAALLGSRPWSLVWCAGFAAAIAALFSTAAGLLVATAAGLVMLGQLRGSATPVRQLTAIAALGAVSVTGLLLLKTPEHHQAAHAQTAAQFFGTLGNCLAWPRRDGFAWLLVVQLPLPWLVVECIRRRTPLAFGLRLACGLGVLALLNAVAIAYSRAGGLFNLMPISRYFTPLTLGIVAQMMALAHLLRHPGLVRRLFAGLWIVAVVGGLIHLSVSNFTLELRYKRHLDLKSEAALRNYLETGDAEQFRKEVTFPMLHPDPQTVLQVLNDPMLRPVLPSALRHPEIDFVQTRPAHLRHGAAFSAVAVAAFLSVVTMLFARRTMPDQPGPAKRAAG